MDEAAIDEIGRKIKDARLWAFQQFQNRVVYHESFRERKPFTPEKVKALAMRAEPYVKKVIVRGI